MQARMKNHQLTESQIEELLRTEKVGRIATINPDGTPYVVPVHFVYSNGRIYIHGLSKGQKIDNILLNGAVCFEVDFMRGLVMHEKPCNVNTSYQSVVVNGVATLVDDVEVKRAALYKIVKKYTPVLLEKEFPERSVTQTCVIEIRITACTGKYYEE